MIVYKTLLPDGRSEYRHYLWPLPKGGQPSRWIEIKARPVLCSRGFHGWLDKDKALGPAYSKQYRVFEMELDGEIVSDKEKAAGQRARLLREVNHDVEPVKVEFGERICETCGEPHWSYKVPGSRWAPNWAHPSDGHSYRAESWEALARRLLAERAAA